MEKKRKLFDIKLNSLSETDNPTKVEVEFIIHDFEVNHNNVLIRKETAQKALSTLKDCPIVARYYPVSSAGKNDDALGSHEVFLDKDRKTGETIIGYNTVPIGVFTEPAYIKTIEENGKTKEVVAGKGVLWASRFPNVIGLLKEWLDNGVTIHSSMEILYDEFHFKDGVEEILNYVYEGHCILNSEDRGNHSKVYPAYDISKLTRLVAQAVLNEHGLNSKEDKSVSTFKKILELSHSDIRTLLYQELSKVLSENEYENSWIVDVWDNRFIYQIWIENQGAKFYEVPYTKSENAVSIDFENKNEVVQEVRWIKVEEVQDLQTKLEEKENEIKAIQQQLDEANSGLQNLKAEKENIENQFKEATEKLVYLNAQIEELKEIKEQYQKEQYEKALKEKQDYYLAKFEAVNAKEKFESEEVQELIKKAVHDNDEGRNAILQLNSMLVEFVQPVKPSENVGIKEFASKRESLNVVDDDFDSRYSI